MVYCDAGLTGVPEGLCCSGATASRCVDEVNKRKRVWGLNWGRGGAGIAVRAGKGFEKAFLGQRGPTPVWEQPLVPVSEVWTHLTGRRKPPMASEQERPEGNHVR